jgi:hypothetical protein
MTRLRPEKPPAIVWFREIFHLLNILISTQNFELKDRQRLAMILLGFQNSPVAG